MRQLQYDLDEYIDQLRLKVRMGSTSLELHLLEAELKVHTYIHTFIHTYIHTYIHSKYVLTTPDMCMHT